MLEDNNHSSHGGENDVSIEMVKVTPKTSIEVVY